MSLSETSLPEQPAVTTSAEAPLAAPVETAGLAPVSRGERISSVDVARGFALLGILLMNIIGWGLPFAAYFNPTVAGGAAGWNLAAWCIQMIAFDGKMRALFSMLFGAGVVILTARGERRGAGIRTADIYYRRTLWLLVFGVLHAYLLWWGDILYPYALCGLALFPLRNLRPRNLLIVSAIMFVILTGGSAAHGLMLQDTRDKALAADRAQRNGVVLTDEQKQAKDDWEKFRKMMQPTPDEVKKEIDAYRGGFISAVKQRAAIASAWHAKPFYSPAFFDMYAMMIAGMAFLKLGILTAERSSGFYWKMAGAGFLLGLPVNAVSTWLVIRHGFDVTTLYVDFAAYQLGRLAVALGYLSLVMLVVKAGALRRLTGALAAVGQMALSNYILQSVLCNFLFYGYGLGLFATMQRYQLYALMLGVWAVSLLWSPLWLRRYQFGPLEWCWRSLTYWKRQPMRIAAARGSGVPATL